MSERVQRALDGELSRQQLTPDEAVELEAYEQVIRDTVAQMSPLRAPDFAPAVMRRIGSRAPSGSAFARAAHMIRRWLDWAWSPRPFVVRPAYVAVSILFVLGAAVLAGRAPVAERGAERADAPRVFVHFRIDAPDAAEVRLAGDFTGWEPTYTLHETAAGVWSTIVPLAPGVHHYAFFIDGDHWVPDPHAAQVDDGFGGVNSRVAVLLPEPIE
ncbi:MAG: glycogen-binding domain-containing protein [Longimicrobiales bacterium]